MKTINLTVPQGWHELDDKQLRYQFAPTLSNVTEIVSGKHRKEKGASASPVVLKEILFIGDEHSWFFAYNLGREFQG